MSDGTEANGLDRSEDPPRSNRMAFQQLRPEDHAVLECIRQGDDTVRKINKRTVDGFDKDNINYAFRKLEDLDLIVVQHREGWTTSILENGEPRRHRKSKQAALTERGMAYFDWKSRGADLGLYAAEPSNDQTKTVQGLCAKIDNLQSRLAELESQQGEQAKRISTLQASQTALKQEVQQIKEALRQYVPRIPDQLPVLGSSDDD